MKSILFYLIPQWVVHTTTRRDIGIIEKATSIDPIAEGMISKIVVRSNSFYAEKSIERRSDIVAREKDISTFKDTGVIEQVTPLKPIADGMISKVTCSPNSNSGEKRDSMKGGEIMKREDVERVRDIGIIEKARSIDPIAVRMISKVVVRSNSFYAEKKRRNDEIIARKIIPSTRDMGVFEKVTPLNPIADGMISEVVTRTNLKIARPGSITDDFNVEMTEKATFNNPISDEMIGLSKNVNSKRSNAGKEMIVQDSSIEAEIENMMPLNPIADEIIFKTKNNFNV